MFFRKIIFLILCCLGFNHCGLQLNEEFHIQDVLTFEETESLCSEIDYIEEIKFYFSDYVTLDSKSSSQNFFNESNKRVGDFFECIIKKGILYRKRLRGEHATEHFTPEDIKKILNDPLIKTKNVENFITDITDWDHDKDTTDEQYFPKAWNLKRNILYLMKQNQKSQPVDFKDQCLVTDLNSEVLLKTEIDDFIKFLERSQGFFLRINQSVQQAENILEEQNSFHDVLTKEELLNVLTNKEFISNSGLSFLADINLKTLNRLLDSLLSIDSTSNQSSYFSVPIKRYIDTRPYFDSIQSRITRSQLLKYSLTNLYISKLLFEIYDKNKNHLLETEELDNAFCLFEPLLSILSHLYFLKNKFNFVQNAYRPENIFYYMVNHQEEPGVNIRYILFLGNILLRKKSYLEKITLDYGDMSRILMYGLSKFLPIVSEPSK